MDAVKQPTTYLSPEECAIGEGLRCLHDPRFFHVSEPEPLPAPLLAEIEEALARRRCEFARVLQIARFGANTP